MSKTFFPLRPESNPTIYAYELIGVKGHENLLKVGYTSRSSKDRIAEQLKTSRVKYNIVLFQCETHIIFRLGMSHNKNPIQADFDLLLLGFKFVQMGQ